MKREVIDCTEKLKDYLFENAKLFKHSDIEASGRTLLVYELPESKEDEFMRLYWKSATPWEERDNFPSQPTANKPIILFRDFGRCTGPFKYRMAGYDFDGFYTSGAQGQHACKAYMQFQEALWYFDEIVPGRRVEYCPARYPKETMVVAFMPENKTEKKES